MSARPANEPIDTADELTIDALAQRVDLPVRTIREYQTQGLLPPPARRGRVGVYGPAHVARLELIGRLQARGYSLAGIRDLLGAWRDGGDLTEVLGLLPDQLVQLDEPGAPATETQLEQALPALVPDRLGDLLATGVVERCEPDRLCIPSPSLLQLAVDALDAGYDPDAVLAMLHAVRGAADAVADAALDTMSVRPALATTDELVAFAMRARGLLAHGTGRLTIHRLGKRLGITDDAEVTGSLRQHLEVEDR